jgi:sugar phosphate isomerase/epimerase
MHLGVCHHVTLPGEWDQAIADAGALGFEGIELFVRSNTKADLLDRPERVASLRAAADRAGINFPSLGLVFYGPNFRLYELDLDARAKAVQQTRVGIERCAELGSRVVLVPGAPPLSDQPAVEAYVGSIKDLATTAATLGVKLGIETATTRRRPRRSSDRSAAPGLETISIPETPPGRAGTRLRIFASGRG